MGKYSSQTSLEACEVCPKDSYGQSEGAIFCERCPFGEDSAEGATRDSQSFSSAELFADLFVLIGTDFDGPNDDGTVRSLEGSFFTESTQDWLSTNIGVTKRGSDVAFLDPNNFLLVEESESDHDVHHYDTGGTELNIRLFARLPNRILDIIFIGDRNLVAIACQDKNIYFFGADGKNTTDGKLDENGYNKDDARHKLELDKIPASIAMSNVSTEILVSTFEDDDEQKFGPVVMCSIEVDDCKNDKQTLLVDKGGYVAVDLDDETFFVLTQDSTETYDKICRCKLSIRDGETENPDDCEVIVEKKRSTINEDDKYVFFQIDPSKKLLYVLVGRLGYIYVYDYSAITPELDFDEGYFKYPVLASHETISKIYFRPSFTAQTSTIDTPTNGVTAGSDILLPLNLRDQVKNRIAAKQNIEEIEGGMLLKANGWIPTQVPGLNGAVEVVGTTKISNSSLTDYSVSGLLNLKIAAEWEISVMGTDMNRELKHLSGSPFTVDVKFAQTDPDEIVALEWPRTVMAGKPFHAKFRTHDSYKNPTNNYGDNLEWFIRPDDHLMKPLIYNHENSTFEITTTRDEAQEYQIEIMFNQGNRFSKYPVKGSPFIYEILPAALELGRSKNTINNRGVDRLVLELEEYLKIPTHDSSPPDSAITMKVVPVDRHDNFITNQKGFTAEIIYTNDDGESDDVLEVELRGPNYEYKIDIKQGLRGKYMLGFKYKGPDDEEASYLDKSPIEFTVTPGEGDGMSTEDILIISGISILPLGLIVRFIAIRAIQRRMINMKAQYEKNEQKLQFDMQNLNESLKKKKHSDKEIEVMKKALEEIEQEREDELRTVLIDSSKINIVSLLGQGAFGTVSLATYKRDESSEEQQVAVKQLMSIDDESIERFRFECFLTKELVHPNIVRLVGVCWDEMMLGCCLEYIDGGSLEDRLRKDWTLPKEEKMTWKGVMLKLAIQAAMGVQYLHHSQYYDEKAKEMKDCIIHRDLKPDNMLVTKAPDNVLKLTDFGEARAQELNMTMTAVGTPIYISPEIMRNDRYDMKSDSYSFGVVLLAMIRAEKNIIEFFFKSLMKKMKKKNRDGVGLNSMNRYLENGWKPPVPVEFYPKFRRLISDCMDKDAAERPDFDEIVKQVRHVSKFLRLNFRPLANTDSHTCTFYF